MAEANSRGLILPEVLFYTLDHRDDSWHKPNKRSGKSKRFAERNLSCATILHRDSRNSVRLLQPKSVDPEISCETEACRNRFRNLKKPLPAPRLSRFN